MCHTGQQQLHNEEVRRNSVSFFFSSQNVSTNAVSWKYFNHRLSGIADIPVNKEWFGVSYHAESRYLVSSIFAPFNQ